MPEDVFQNTSDALSALMAAVLDDDDLAQPATLASVREAVLSNITTPTIPLNRFSTEQSQELHDEIDALIDEYGGDALAVRFMQPWGSEPLGRLISAGLDELGTPSLGSLLASAERGLLPRLIAQGEIDDDEAQTVIAELKSLIDRHGEDALAENFQGNT
jgi:hypothetical protein